MLEEALLSEFGAGRYTVMPLYDGRFHPAAYVPVGDPGQHGTRRREAEEMKNLSEERDRLVRENAASREKLINTAIEKAPNIIRVLRGQQIDDTAAQEASKGVGQRPLDQTREVQELTDRVATLQRQRQQAKRTARRHEADMSALKRELTRQNETSAAERFDVTALVPPALIVGALTALARQTNATPKPAPKPTDPSNAASSSPFDDGALSSMLAEQLRPENLRQRPRTKLRFSTKFPDRRPKTGGDGS